MLFRMLSDLPVCGCLGRLFIWLVCPLTVSVMLEGSYLQVPLDFFGSRCLEA